MSIHPQDMEKRLKHILDQMRSEDREEKREGYRRLREGAKALHAGLSEENVALLAEILDNEPDPALALKGMAAFIKMVMLSGLAISAASKTRVLRHAAPETPAPRHVGAWLFWDIKQQKSAIFAVRDSERFLRDETAENQILRRLSPPENFPLLDTKHFFTGEQRAHRDLQDAGYKAVVFIGRLELYGPAFEDLIRCRAQAAGEDPTAADAMRFEFEVDHRPTDLPRNKIDPHYHCIVDRQGNGKPIRYETVDDGKQRTDYCIVQRYVAEISADTKVVVVGVLGASALGTFGGAKWCGLLLFREESIIPLPPGVHPHSRMEALLRVTADSTLGGWESPRIDLVSLYLDEQEWSATERKWRKSRKSFRGPEEITVNYRDGKASSVLFDGHPRNLKLGSNMFVLIVALAENALEGHNCVSIDELQAALKKKVTTRQLSMVRTRYLHDALSVESSSASLHFKVRRVDES